MCDKCQELQTKIERYRRIMARADDPQLAAGIKGLIEEAETELTALHREQQSKAV